jgi:hypothetical protein
MKKKEINRFWVWTDGGLRRVCSGLSPKRRLITILAFCAIFGSMSIHMTVSSIYNIGKRDAKKKYMKIGHIKEFELQHSNDSINHVKKQIYERK